MTQNIYDQDGFFAAYNQLGRSEKGLDGAPEWPVVQRLLPPVAERRIADLGCGYGWFARWARTQGAGQVDAFDVSVRMLEHARGFGEDPRIAYTRADLESLVLKANTYDLVYSSLALHYVINLRHLFETVFAALRPGGRLVFSIEHPIFMASRRAQWLTGADGRAFWPVDSYQQEGGRKTRWLGEEVIKQHRTLGTLLTTLIRAGFALSHVEDWGPSAAQIDAMPELAKEMERPMFLLAAADRR